MGATENTELVRHVYSEVSKGNGQPMLEHMADDIVWTIIGSTPLSGVFRGRDEVVTTLFGGLRQALQAPVAYTFDRFVAEGDHVVMEAHGKAVTRTGRPYENRYCVILTVVDGRFQEIIDYVDTELVRNTLFE